MHQGPIYKLRMMCIHRGLPQEFKQHEELKLQQPKDGKIYNQEMAWQKKIIIQKRPSSKVPGRTRYFLHQSSQLRWQGTREFQFWSHIGKAKDHCKHSTEPEHIDVHTCQDTQAMLPRHLRYRRPPDQPKNMAMLLNRNLNTTGNFSLIKCLCYEWMFQWLY